MNGCHTVIRRGPAAGLNIYAAFIPFSFSVDLFAFRLRRLSFQPRLSQRQSGSGSKVSTAETLLFLTEGELTRRATMLKLIVLAALAGFTQASDVLEFTDSDFESKIEDHEIILVEFFAPW